jgi:anaerobic selenocysteine-containing dehydrogenase
MLADLHLPIRPRRTSALINGSIHIVIEHDLIDRDYIARTPPVRGAS